MTREPLYLRDTLKELNKTLKELILIHLVLLKGRRKRKLIGLCIPLVNLKLKNLLKITMMTLFLMLKLNLVVNMHLVIMKMIRMSFMRYSNK